MSQQWNSSRPRSNCGFSYEIPNHASTCSTPFSRKCWRNAPQKAFHACKPSKRPARQKAWTTNPDSAMPRWNLHMFLNQTTR